MRYTPVAPGSSRYKLKNEADYERLVEAFAGMTSAIFYIGGNDSMDTAHKIHSLARKINYEMHVMGIPKTIDNDLPFTDHARDTAARPGCGRHGHGDRAGFKRPDHFHSHCSAGNHGPQYRWIAAASALAKRQEDDAPHLIYLPETPFNRRRFVEDVHRVYKEYGCAYVVVSEGLPLRKASIFVPTAY